MNIIRMRYLLLLVLIVTMVGGGCNPWAKVAKQSNSGVAVSGTEPIVKVTTTTTEAVVSVRNVEIKQSSDQKGLFRCSIAITYPQFVLSGSNSNADSASINKINSVIAERAASGTFGQLDGEGNEQSIKSMAAKYTQECFDERFRLAKKFSDYPEDSEWYKNMIVKVEYQGHGIASLSFDYEAYEGGAHPGHMTKFMNISLKDGKSFTLKDVINPENLLDFIRAEKKQILDRSQGDDNILFPESEEAFKNIAFSTSTPSVDEQLAAYGDFDSFYLMPTAIATHYNEYEIAPYVSGAQEAILAYSDIASWIKSDGPLGFISEQFEW